jgi:hypothetical protein
MTGFTPFKKLMLSIGCAFLLILYVPLACLVGNDSTGDSGVALAETESFEEETTEEIIEFDFSEAR